MKHRRTKYEFYISMAVFNFMTVVVFSLFFAPAPGPIASVPVMAYSPKTNEPAIAPAVVGAPVKIVVPGVGINLEVSPGTYDESIGDWTLSYSQALHADSSMPINDVNGTTLIYAHALPGLFGALTGLSPGMTAEVQTDNSRIFSYRFVSQTDVLPADTTVFTAEGPPTLVLQTCSGPWDAYRSLYSFEFIGERAT